MKIGLMEFLTYFYIGGTERQVMNLSTRVDRKRFDLHMGCLGRVGPLIREAAVAGIPVEEYRIDSLYDVASLRTRLRLGRYLREHSTDIMHSYGFYSNLFAIPAAKMAGVPVVIAAIRDCGETLTPLQKHAQKICCTMADCILVNADGVRDWLLECGYPGEKIQVIRNGIIPEGSEMRQPTGKLHAELGLSPDTPLVAVLSRLNPMKGLEYFLDAAAQLAPKFPDARFLIIGGPDQKNDDHYEAGIKAHAAALGLGNRVIFTGFRTDVAEILPELAMSVSPSLSEGLSNSLLESMAAGLPVVATHVGGTPEIVVDGSTGLLVPSRDAGALSTAMRLLLEDSQWAGRLGASGRRRVVARFSIERMVRQTESLYMDLLTAKHAHPITHEVAA